MKKISTLVLAIAVTGVAFVSSCKKGENDPTISLRSRKSRVAGEWKVASAENTYTTTGTSGTTNNSSTTTETFGSGTYSQTMSSTYGSTTTSTKKSGTVATQTYTFEKDGTWKSVLDYTTTETETETPFTGYTVTSTTETHYVINESGVWNFLGKVQDDTKNKEEMSVSTTSTNRTVDTKTTTTTTYNGTTTTDTDNDSQTTSNTYGNNENVSVWKITQLKNDEMIVEAVGGGNSSSSYTSTNGGTSTTSTSSGTHTSAAKMTLTQE